MDLVFSLMLCFLDSISQHKSNSGAFLASVQNHTHTFDRDSLIVHVMLTVSLKSIY